VWQRPEDAASGYRVDPYGLRDRGVQPHPLVSPDTGQDQLRGVGVGDERPRIGPVVHRVVAVTDGVDHLAQPGPRVVG